MTLSERSELTFQKGAAANESVIYPCVVADLSPDNMMVNPCDGKQNGIKAPFRPGCAEYEEEADALVRVAMDVQRGIWPEWYFDFCGINPELSPVLKLAGLTESDPQSAAGFVRMDQPEELWAAIVRYSAVAGVEVDPIDERGIPFLERHVSPLELFATVNKEAMRKAFQAKYYYGVPRPEEYFKSPNLAHYPEGCPGHPSYPAGHGTFAGVAHGTFKRAYPKAEQRHLIDVATATLQLAHLRDLARVHTRQDSRTGWDFGTEQVAEVVLAQAA